MHTFAADGPRLLFAGPTYGALERPDLASEFELRPPARRGDISLVVNGRPGLIVLVDGHFHQSLSVAHSELRAAIEQGWCVWGLGSLGAIRAFEMRHLGMNGFGQIFEHFLGEEDFQDDEVALLHAPDPPYVAESEPLLHLRYFVAALERDGVLDPPAANLIVDELKQMWFGDRTLDTTISIIQRRASRGAASTAREWLGTFGRFRVKCHDLADFLERRIWLMDDYRPTPQPIPYSRSALADSAAQGMRGPAARQRSMFRGSETPNEDLL
jgi:hypothetical protein